MPAGTIALSNNSTTVTGTGTAFTAELKANDFIVSTVGGVTYTLGIESVGSATALTLIKAYNGPTVSGAAWTALPAAAMSLISSQTAADVARALRTANFDKVNWQQVFSELGDITVTLPDGTQFSGPSWRKISELLATLDVGSITEIAAQIDADADQVATDKPIIVQAKNDAVAANADAQQAKADAQAASQSAQQAKTDATNQAGIAKTEADRAKTEADRAAQSGVSLAMVDDHLAPWGFGGTVLPPITNLNAVAGSSDRSVHFTYTAAATPNPASGSAGRGLMIAEDANSGTQIVWVNGTGASWYRNKVSGAWGAWIQAGGGVSLTDVKSMIDACFPIGIPVYWPTSTLPDNSTYGIKFLRWNGGPFSTTTYPKLAAVHPSGVLPDARADVIRVWDDSRGIDPSRSLLSEQTSAAPNITGGYTNSAGAGTTRSSDGSVSGAFTRSASTKANGFSVGAATSYDLLFNAGLVSSVYQDGVTELRMRNMVLNFIVRAN